MDPNLVLTEAQKQERFSNRLKLPSRPNKLSPAKKLENTQQKKSNKSRNLRAIGFSTESNSKQSISILSNTASTDPFMNVDPKAKIEVYDSKVTRAEGMNYLMPNSDMMSEKGYVLPYEIKSVNDTEDLFRNQESSKGTNFFQPNSLTSDKKEKLFVIDEIFDTFVPVMRATLISDNFLSKIVNVHKNNTNTAMKLAKEDLIKHLNTLQESFKNFAFSSKMFKNILEADQKVLLERNSVMFVMVGKIKYRNTLVWYRNCLEIKYCTEMINFFFCFAAVYTLPVL